MTFLMIDDEHELYRVMMADIFDQSKYTVQELKKTKMPKWIKVMHDFHYSRRMNKFFEMPGKFIWNKWYELHKYPFKENEKYVVLFMNGTLRNNYNTTYLMNIKKRHQNVKMCLLIFDKSIYYGAKRAISMRECFDYVFSFDIDDCEKYKFEHFYNCFSRPKYIETDNSIESDAFFIGNGGGRLKELQSFFKYLASQQNTNCRFYITGIKESEKVTISNVVYNKPMSFYREMQYSYNSNCLIEILRKGQSGISLRVCEAIAFNKKLITNNKELKKLPFYDERYMRIFDSPSDIDIDFITQKTKVQYKEMNFFSPVKILDRISELEENEKRCSLGSL